MKCLRWASAVLFLASCGQDPSFTEVGAGSSKQQDAIGSGEGSGSSSDGSVESGDIVLDPIDPDVIAENGSSPSSPGVPPSTPSSPVVPPSSPGVPPSTPSSPAPGGSTVISSNPSNPTAPTFTIPNASPDDVNQIKKCVMKWGFSRIFDSLLSIIAIFHCSR